MTERTQRKIGAALLVLAWCGASFFFPLFMPFEAAVLVGVFGGMLVGGVAVIRAFG